MAESNHDDPSSGAVGPADGGPHVPMQLDIPLPAGNAETLSLVARYCQLPHRTMHAALPRSAADFFSAITSDERTFLAQELPLVSHVPQAFELLRLADFLQFHDLKLLVAGYVATALAGKSTAAMRGVLGVAGDDAVLFTPDTQRLIQLEKKWMSEA
jgi:hypothetical protein